MKKEKKTTTIFNGLKPGYAVVQQQLYQPHLIHSEYGNYKSYKDFAQRESIIFFDGPLLEDDLILHSISLRIDCEPLEFKENRRGRDFYKMAEEDVQFMETVSSQIVFECSITDSNGKISLFPALQQSLMSDDRKEEYYKHFPSFRENYCYAIRGRVIPGGHKFCAKLILTDEKKQVLSSLEGPGERKVRLVTNLSGMRQITQEAMRRHQEASYEDIGRAVGGKSD